MHEEPSNRDSSIVSDIERALVGLLGSTSLGKVTVTQIVKQAHISRTTFYRHFDSVTDVVDSIEDRIFDAMRDVNRWAIIEPVNRASIHLTQSCLARMTYIHDHRDVVIALAGKNGDPLFFQKASQIIEDYWKQRLSAQAGLNVDIEMFSAFMVAGHNAIVRKWLFEHPELTPSEVGEFLNLMFYSVFNGIEQ